MSTILSDLRFALRQIRRNPGFAAVAALTMGLGIGAAVVIFSVANTVILSPLPFSEPDRLIRFQETNRDGAPFSISAPNFLDFREQSRSFSHLVSFTVRPMTLLGSGDPEQATGMPVSEGFLEMLQVTPLLGRGFAADEFPVAAEGQVAILSHGLWERRFSSDPGVLGRTLSVDGTPRTVVGVTPQDFQLPFGVELWVPFGPDPAFARGDHRLEAMGRLAEGVTVDQARREMSQIAARLGEIFPDTNGEWGVRLRTFTEWMIGPRVTRIVTVLFGAVGLLLLLACASVSNLLVARATTRQKEIALRSALGAGQLRILSQLLLESVLLSSAGAAVGLLIAGWGIPLIQSLNTSALPRLDQLTLDNTALFFAVVTAVATGLLFGAAPAIHAARGNLAAAIHAGARGGQGGTRRTRDILVVGQLALALMLLVGAGLLSGSFVRLVNVDPGFDPEEVLTVRITPRADQYPEFSPQVAFFFRDVEERIEAIPGVQAVGATMVSPFQGPSPANTVGAEGQFTEIGEMIQIQWRSVTPGFFDAMRIPLVRGRYLDRRDNLYDQGIAPPPDGAPPAISVMIGTDLAERLWPAEDPIGKRLVWSQPDGPAMTVVGVVDEIRDLRLNAQPAPMVFLPHGLVQWPQMTMVVRASGDPAAISGAVREAIWAVDPNTPVPEMQTLSETVDLALSGSRLNMQLVGIFALAALALAALGIYGIISFSVAQRTRELGIRIALGAQPGGLVGLVLRQGGLLILLGVTAGIAGALALSRFMGSILFEIEPTSPITYASVTLILVAVAGVASYLPARRATRVDPKVAFTEE